MNKLEIGRIYLLKEKIVVYNKQYNINTANQFIVEPGEVFLILNEFIHTNRVQGYEILSNNKKMFFFINHFFDEDKEIDKIFELII